MTPVSPEQAARWMVDPNDPDNRRKGTVLISNAPFGGEDAYVRVYRDYVRNERDPLVKAAAITALGRWGDPEDAVAIGASFEEENLQVRWEAAKSLQRLHNPAVVGVLLAVVRNEEEDNDVRVAAAVALGQYPQDNVFQGLVGALDVRYLSVNEASRKSLDTLTGQDFGFEPEEWLRWYNNTDDPFAGRKEYRYPTYSRKERLPREARLLVDQGSTSNRHRRPAWSRPPAGRTRTATNRRQMKQAADPKTPHKKTTMRALRFDGSDPKLAVNHPRPEPQRGEALLRVRRAAVSAIDVEICKGLFDFTGTLGHEFVAQVESMAGDDRPELVGARVVGSVAAVCGRCDMCQSGLSAHCRHQTLCGIQGRDGCFADWLVLPVHNLVPVPDSVDDDHAVFVESLAAAVQSARQLTIEGKPYITILGDGPLGLLMAQVMAKLNASVRLIGRYSEKLALCERWSVKHRHVDDIGRRADQDIVVDCTGSAGGLELAMELVRPRGTIVLKTLFAGDAGTPLEVDRSPLVMKEITLLGSRAGPLSEALSMIERGAVDVVSLIGKRMTLNDGPGVIQAAARPGMLKVLVDI